MAAVVASVSTPTPPSGGTPDSPSSISMSNNNNTSPAASTATDTVTATTTATTTTIPTNTTTKTVISPPGSSDVSSSGNEKLSRSDGTPSITVFHDPNNFNVKHPLMHSWTLWFTKPPIGKRTGENWNNSLKEVISFDSVEEFWGIYNNIARTSEMACKSDYHLFKKGIRPEWEDALNKHGGKWSYQFNDRNSVDINTVWLHVMLAAIGGNLEDEDDNEVMGVVVNVRPTFYRIGLWTHTSGKALPSNLDKLGKGCTAEQSVQSLQKVGRRFKAALELPESETVKFSGHTELPSSSGARFKTRLSV